MSSKAPGTGAGARLAFVLGLFIFIVGAPQAYGQEFGRIDDTETNIDAFYYLVEPGVATIQLSVFGKVKNPGVYVLEDGTNLALTPWLERWPYVVKSTRHQTDNNCPDVPKLRQHAFTGLRGIVR